MSVSGVSRRGARGVARGNCTEAARALPSRPLLVCIEKYAAFWVVKVWSWLSKFAFLCGSIKSSGGAFDKRMQRAVMYVHIICLHCIFNIELS